MNFTSATVRAGENSANFSVRLPQVSTESHLNCKYRGYPLRLWFEPSPLPDDVRYQMVFDYDLDPGSRVYPFILATHKSKDAADKHNTPPDVISRLDVHRKAYIKIWPEFKEHPLIYYDQDTNRAEPGYVVQLPPRTAIYTTNRQLWYSMGFRSKVVEDQRVIGGRGSKIAKSVVHGFFNMQKTRVLEIKADVYIMPGQKLEDFLEEGQTRKAAEASMPARTQLQVEFLDLEGVNLTYGGGAGYPADADTMIDRIREICKAFTDQYNLATNFIDCYPVTAGGNSKSGNLVLANRAMVGSKMQMSLRFGRELAQSLRLPAEHALIFALGTTRSYVLSLDDGRSDPFSGHYPVMVFSPGTGDPGNYVEGLGRLPFFACISELGSGGERKIYTEGVPFETDFSNLQLIFTDHSLKRIAFKKEAVMHLLLKFKPVISKPSTL
jgi:hypothetical protein